MNILNGMGGMFLLWKHNGLTLRNIGQHQILYGMGGVFLQGRHVKSLLGPFLKAQEGYKFET